MHIPDNYLSPGTCAVMGAAMIPVWTISAKKVSKELSNSKVPLLGIGAAFAFLMMMFNVPLPGGTTGHAVGGTLLAILLGPWSACICVTISLLIQALIFGDGGLLAFGANCFNMAFVLPFVGYYLYKVIKNRVSSNTGEYVAIAIGSWVGIVVASLCAAIEFGIQPIFFKDAAGHAMYCPYPLSVSIPAMVLPHMLVCGVAEAAFAVSIIAFIKKLSPGMIYEGAKSRFSAVYGLIITLICISPLGLLAAGTAWGEWGADEIEKVTSGGSALGYVPAGMKTGLDFHAIFDDYKVKGLPEWTGYIISAAAGAAILIIVFKIIGVFLKKRKGCAV